MLELRLIEQEDRFTSAMATLVKTMEEKMEINMQQLKNEIMDKVEDKLLAQETRFTSAFTDLATRKDRDANKSEIKQESVSVGKINAYNSMKNLIELCI